MSREWIKQTYTSPVHLIFAHLDCTVRDSGYKHAGPSSTWSLVHRHNTCMWSKCLCLCSLPVIGNICEEHLQSCGGSVYTKLPPHVCTLHVFGRAVADASTLVLALLVHGRVLWRRNWIVGLLSTLVSSSYLESLRSFILPTLLTEENRDGTWDHLPAKQEFCHWALAIAELHLAQEDCGMRVALLCKKFHPSGRQRNKTPVIWVPFYWGSSILHRNTYLSESQTRYFKLE